MREIDDVRITLLRMFRGAVRLPQEIIDELLTAFLHTQDAAIKVQAYGRGLLARFRDHNLLFRTPFNTQARVLHDNYMVSGATPYISTNLFQGETRVLYEAKEANSYWRRHHNGHTQPEMTSTLGWEEHRAHSATDGKRKTGYWSQKREHTLRGTPHVIVAEA